MKFLTGSSLGASSTATSKDDFVFPVRLGVLGSVYYSFKKLCA